MNGIRITQRTGLFRGGAGFSLIELLVVTAIIAALVGILVPGLRGVSRHAKGLRQKSQFHSMEVGLELFHKDFDGYPDSTLLSIGGTNYICGTQHLTEAFLGRDLRGFDPKTTWYAPGEETATDTQRYANLAKGSTADEIRESDNRRKGLYIEMRDIGVYVLEELYPSPSYTGPVYSSSSDAGKAWRAPVITDVFLKKKVTLLDGSTAKVGTPILYYKANTATKSFKGELDAADKTLTDGVYPYTKWIYNYEDNQPLIELGSIEDPIDKHHFDSTYTYIDSGVTKNGIDLFYETLTNPKASVGNITRDDMKHRPFNTSMFILISAGWDGIFGTKDDITNFDY